MSQDLLEERIRGLAARLRRLDESQAPAFEEVLSRRRAPRRSSVRRFVPIAAVLVVLAALATEPVSWPFREERPPTVAELRSFYWQSPTAVLLVPPSAFDRQATGHDAPSESQE